MADNKVTELIMILRDKLPDDKLLLIKEKLIAADDRKYSDILQTKFYNPMEILLFSIFIGVFGIDRFILGDIGLGIGKLLLGWLTFGLWYILDIFFSYKRAKELNYEKLLLIL